MKTIALLIFAGLSPLAVAQVGETADQLTARYGAGTDSHGYRTIMRAGGIAMIALPGDNGKTRSIIYRRPDQKSSDGLAHLTKAEIMQFLAENGKKWTDGKGKAEWTSKAGPTAYYADKTLTVSVAR